MKKITILLILLGTIKVVTAQDGFKYIHLNVGTMIRNQIVSEISYEWMTKNYTGNEILIEGAYNHRTERKNLLIGFAYKPLIIRNKNTGVHLRLSGSIGSDNSDFICATGIGLEGFLSFSNGWILTLSQKNQAVFFDEQKWRFGALVGLKIPLNH